MAVYVDIFVYFSGTFLQLRCCLQPAKVIVWVTNVCLSVCVDAVKLFFHIATPPTVFAARCYAIKCGLCRHAVSVCAFVCHVRGSCKNE